MAKWKQTGTLVNTNCIVAIHWIAISSKFDGCSCCVVFNENASGNSRDLFDHYYYLLQPRSNIVAHRSYLFFSFCSAISDCWATKPYIYYKCTLPVAKFSFFTFSNWVFFQKLMEVCDNLKFMWLHFQNIRNGLSKRDGVVQSGPRQLSTASILSQPSWQVMVYCTRIRTRGAMAHTSRKFWLGKMAVKNGKFSLCYRNGILTHTKVV